jgi:hypothetical protein
LKDELRDYLENWASAGTSEATKDRLVAINAEEALNIVEYIEDLEDRIDELEYEASERQEEFYCACDNDL